ncbi:MAG: hypothetical protein K2R93_14415 [Gemmatimonadaceae bacterium]|nr:hypothetical protein [Gemmatimonadaceae bacterium]
MQLEPHPVLASVPPGDVQFFDDVTLEEIDAAHVQRIGIVGEKALKGFSTEAVSARKQARETVASAGANAFLRRDKRSLVAVHLDSAGFATVRSISSARTARAIGASRDGASAKSGDVVQVKGYCRKDGVCVAPHTRAKPSSKGSTKSTGGTSSSGRRRR